MSKTIALVGIWALALGLIALVQWGGGSSASQTIPQATLPPTLTSAPTAGAAAGDAAYGKALFVAKGCVSCHAHSDFTASSESFGPNLSKYEPDPAYVRRWLADPAAIKPSTQMPNLNLSRAEIEDLLAYLQR